MSFLNDDQLLSLISSNKYEEAKSFIRNGNLFNAVDDGKHTLLHYAAEFGNAEIVQFLIDSGSEIDALNNAGKTPLISCVESDQPSIKVVEILLKARADIYMEDIHGHRIFDKINDVDWLNEDIERYKIWKMIFDQGPSLTSMSLLYKGDEKVIKSLLQTNVDLTTVDSFRRTIAHMLAKNREPGVIKQLHGKNFDVNARDFEGQTPLMFAAYRGNVNAVEFLLKEGADIEATDNQKKTALYLAIRVYGMIPLQDEFKSTVQVLLEHGANIQIETNADTGKTIFDAISNSRNIESLTVVKLPLAHLALQEALGTPITDLIRKKINKNQRFKTYFEKYQQELLIEIHPSVKLFDVLTVSERQLECYLRNEELASKLMNFQTSFYYFDKILSKRVLKASKMIKLKEPAMKIIGKLMEIECSSYPYVFNEIVDYLEEQDIENLILINNEFNLIEHFEVFPIS